MIDSIDESNFCVYIISCILCSKTTSADCFLVQSSQSFLYFQSTIIGAASHVAFHDLYDTYYVHLVSKSSSSHRHHFWHAPLGVHSAKRRHQSPLRVAFSDTDDDIIISSALLIASTFYQRRRQVNVRSIRKVHGDINKQLTNHSSATEREIADE